MKIFDYHCEKCNITEERYIFNKEQENTQTCFECGSTMKKKLSSPAMVKTNHADMPAFRDRK